MAYPIEEDGKVSSAALLRQCPPSLPPGIKTTVLPMLDWRGGGGGRGGKGWGDKGEVGMGS